MSHATATLRTALTKVQLVPLAGGSRTLTPASERKRRRAERGETSSQPTADVHPLKAPDPAEHMDLVRKIARRFGRGLPGNVTQDDLVSAGLEGLVTAAKRFDPSKCPNFVTFAEFRIKGAMLDELRRHDIMSRNQRMLKNKLERAIANLTASLGEPPTDDDLAEFLGVDTASVREVRSSLTGARLVSIDGEAASAAANDSPTANGRALDPERAAIQRGLMRRASELVEQLDPRARLVIQMYFFKGAKLREIAAAIGTTDSRVCQIKRAALAQLRTALAD